MRIVGYKKHVAVRFTLDDWQTTSKVRAKHVVSVLSLPWEVSKTKTLGDAIGLIANSSSGAAALPTWDRFSFTIRLEDHAYKLQDRTLWFVGRYSTGDGGIGGIIIWAKIIRLRSRLFMLKEGKKLEGFSADLVR